jgi:lysyl-tRNA synthetase class 2
MYQNIRAFFTHINYMEVDTPLLGRFTNTDVHIQSIQARVNKQPFFLQTSPEFCMKRLLSEGSGSIFQICHAFRDEENGRRHAAEFSLLEWYSLGFDYQSLMTQIEQLISVLIPGGTSFERVTYVDCFRSKLDLDPIQASTAECQQCAERFVPGIDARQLPRDACLDLLISEIIAPQFDGFTFVYDYPASMAALARIKTDNTEVAERFELFYNDIELANGYSELTDVNEQRRRFRLDNEQRKQLGLAECAVDENFLRALELGLPECAGVALGLDRLLMVMAGADSIQQVLSIDDEFISVP